MTSRTSGQRTQVEMKVLLIGADRRWVTLLDPVGFKQITVSDTNGMDNMLDWKREDLKVGDLVQVRLPSDIADAMGLGVNPTTTKNIQQKNG